MVDLPDIPGGEEINVSPPPEERAVPTPRAAADEAPETAPATLTSRSWDDVVAGLPEEGEIEQTVLERGLKTTAKVAAGTGARQGGAAAGAFAGAALGAPFLPPFGSLAGGLIGLTGGYFAGDLAADELERQGLATTVEAVPPEMRGFAVAGESFAASASILGPQMAAARTGMRLAPSAVGSFFNATLDMAREQPFRFLAAEATAAGSAAIAGGAYEAFRPNRPGERAAAEIMGGLLNPTRLAVGASGLVFKSLKSSVSKILPGPRKTRAGQLLVEFLAAADGSGDPDVLIQELKNTEMLRQSIPGFRGTAAQTTGDARVAQLEAELAELDRVFGSEVSERAKDTIDAITNALELIARTGDSELLKLAATLRATRSRLALERLELGARREAVQAAEAVSGGGTVADRPGLSRQVTDIYVRSLERARAVESDLWKSAFTPEQLAEPGAWRSVTRTSSNLRGELAAADDLPKFIQDELDAVASASVLLRRVAAGETEMPDGAKITAAAIRQAKRVTSVGEQIRFRSSLLRRSRELARSPGETSAETARQYGLMAEAVLNDLISLGVATRATQAGRRGARGQFVADMTAFDQARAFTRELNDVYSRSFVGAAQQQGSYGMRVPPETLLKRAFATGDEVGSLQLRELAEAVDFLPARAFGNPALLAEANADAGLMMDAQSRLLKIMAGRAITEVTDPATGETVTRVSVSRARTFLREAGDVLERFPEVKKNLEEAVASQEKLERTLRYATGRRKLLEPDGGTSAIARVLKTDSPADAVRGALTGPRPLERLTEMADLARRGGVFQGQRVSPQEGKDGLRAAILEHVIRRAETPDKDLSLDRLVRGLHEPIRPGLPSLRQFMEAEGLFPAQMSERLDELVDAAARITVARQAIARGEQVVDAPDVLTNLGTRAGGAIVGSYGLGKLKDVVGAHGGQAGLLVAQRSAAAAQTIIDELPSNATRILIQNALRGDPLTPGGAPFSLLEELVKRGSSAPELMRSYMMIHAYAWQAGLLAARDVARGPLPEPDPDEEIRRLFGE